jgi:hypothetical protein
LNFLPKHYLWFLIDKFIPRTFGQLGEDAIIHNHLAWLGLNPNKAGAYIDIGAFHPTRGSNTFRFYQKGSHGIAIDIGVEKERIWKFSRRRDKFINAALVPESYEPEFIKFYKSGNYGSATDHTEGSGVTSKSRGGGNVSVSTLRPSVLGKMILSEPYWENAPWRFISIDIEGLDEEVLLEFDLYKLAPDIIAIEHFLPKEVSDWSKISYLSSCRLVNEMKDRGFSLQSISGPTLIFLRTSSKK